MACCPGLGSGYFAILREYLLRNNNQQSNVPREKFEIWKIWNKDLSKNQFMCYDSYYGVAFEKLSRMARA